MDTSLVSTDYINNPRTMNAIYNLGAATGCGAHWGKETLKGGELNNKQLPKFFDPPDTSWSPRVLKDGSDSVGVLGALNRVYMNIGRIQRRVVDDISIRFSAASRFPRSRSRPPRENSAYWRATEAGTPNMAKFLVKAGQPDRLQDAPGGKQISDGRLRPSWSAARWYSPKPVRVAIRANCRTKRVDEMDPGGCSGPNYLTCWKRYWAYTKTDEFKSKMREIVASPISSTTIISRRKRACR